MSASRYFASLRSLFRRLLLDTAGGSSSPGPNFLPCQNDKEERVSRVIDASGGTIELGGHRLDVPAGAVDGAVEFTMALLPARMLKVRIQANGQGSFAFKVPATLTLSYARCGAAVDPSRLRIYKIDPQSDQVLADLGGTLDAQASTLSATSRTLSVYTLGEP